MSSWLLSVAGISVLTILIDVILPNGQTNKYIKGLVSFCMVFVIISPIPALVKQDFDLEKIFAAQTIEIEKDFVYQVNRTKLSYLQNQVVQALEQEGFANVLVTVNGNIFEMDMKIKNVFVDLSDLVISPNNQHKDIKKTISEIVCRYVQIDEGEIIFNGR